MWYSHPLRELHEQMDKLAVITTSLHRIFLLEKIYHLDGKNIFLFSF